MLCSLSGNDGSQVLEGVAQGAWLHIRATTDGKEAQWLRLGPQGDLAVAAAARYMCGSSCNASAWQRLPTRGSHTS
jgi:hypothetical protein